MSFTLTAIILGFLFGAVIQYANLNKYNVISGMSTLEDFTVAKMMALAMGVGIILINLEISMGMASYHVKPFIVGGIIIGGLLFGIGMAILGYCPGTLPISLGQGSLDAFFGIIGGFLGGAAYTILYPYMDIFMGANLGKLSLHSLVGSGTTFYILIFLIGIGIIIVPFLLQRIDKVKTKQWIVAGVLLAVLNAIMFSDTIFGKAFGASTCYPYTANTLLGLSAETYPYQAKVTGSGSWQIYFLLGALLSGFVISMIKKEFKVTLIHSRWKEYKGKSKGKRILWATIGGFILLFGARMASGCTSGHIISGGMQLAISSLVFSVFVFVGFLITGKFFYRKK